VDGSEIVLGIIHGCREITWTSTAKLPDALLTPEKNAWCLLGAKFRRMADVRDSSPEHRISKWTEIERS